MNQLARYVRGPLILVALLIAVRYAFPSKMTFWCSLSAATISLAPIITCFVLMPHNEHGGRDIETAYEAFAPGVMNGALTALASYRVLRAP